MPKARIAEGRGLMTNAFRDCESAQRAFDCIVARGFKAHEIFVLMSEDTCEELRAQSGAKGVQDPSDIALDAARVGGAVGGVVGASLGGIVAIGAALSIPSLGLVIAGPLVGAIAGATAGATAGGIVGVLVGAGLSEDLARDYQATLEAGGVVVGATPRHDDDAGCFVSEWQARPIDA